MELVTITRGKTVVKFVWATIDAMSLPWVGAFNVPASATFFVGDRCQMETLDGRRATIVVKSADACQMKQAAEPLHERPRAQTRVRFVFTNQLTAEK
jgi:hypothetical protein